MPHFKYNIQRTNIYENVLTINDFVNSYEDPIVLGYFSMTHTIMNDKNYLTLIFYMMVIMAIMELKK